MAFHLLLRIIRTQRERILSEEERAEFCFVVAFEKKIAKNSFENSFLRKEKRNSSSSSLRLLFVFSSFSLFFRQKSSSFDPRRGIKFNHHTASSSSSNRRRRRRRKRREEYFYYSSFKFKTVVVFVVLSNLLLSIKQYVEQTRRSGGTPLVSPRSRLSRRLRAVQLFGPFLRIETFRPEQTNLKSRGTEEERNRQTFRST